MIDYQDEKNVERVFLIIARMPLQSQADAERRAEDILRYQPFLLSMIAGYQQDFSEEVIGHIVDFYCIIWEYFKDEPHIKEIQLTAERYESVEERNCFRIATAMGTSRGKPAKSSFEAYFLEMYSPELFIILLQRLKQIPSIDALDEDSKALLHLALKSVIDALDEIVMSNAK